MTNEFRAYFSMEIALEHIVVPLYYGNRDRFIEVMRHDIALNASHFNTQRMVQEYIVKACF